MATPGTKWKIHIQPPESLKTKRNSLGSKKGKGDSPIETCNGAEEGELREEVKKGLLPKTEAQFGKTWINGFAEEKMACRFHWRACISPPSGFA